MKRVLVALSAGYVLMYYSELVFWAKYDLVGMALPDLLFTYLIYSLVTYIFLSVITRFQVRTSWALFLAVALYAVVTSVVLVGCYWMYNRLCLFTFEPTKIEWSILIIVVLFFYSFTVLVQPAALFVLPPLLGLVYLAMRRNRNKERRKDLVAVLQGEIKPLNYGLLFFIPFVALPVV